MGVLRLPLVYPIADVGTLRARGLDVAAFVRELLEGGAEILQLRNKGGSPGEILAQAAAISELVAGTGCLPVMNDRADLAVLAGWRAVHVGHTDMPPEAVRRVLGGKTASLRLGLELAGAGKANAEDAKDARSRNEGAGGFEASGPGGRRVMVGVSTHDEEQVRAAEAGTADYVAIGPVFGTATKADAEPVVGLEGVRRARALTRKPLVAIGGITRENAASVREAGADSVAVIGGLFGAEGGVAGAMQDFLRRLR